MLVKLIVLVLHQHPGHTPGLLQNVVFMFMNGQVILLSAGCLLSEPPSVSQTLMVREIYSNDQTHTQSRARTRQASSPGP